MCHVPGGRAATTIYCLFHLTHMDVAMQHYRMHLQALQQREVAESRPLACLVHAATLLAGTTPRTRPLRQLGKQRAPPPGDQARLPRPCAAAAAPVCRNDRIHRGQHLLRQRRLARCLPRRRLRKRLLRRLHARERPPVTPRSRPGAARRAGRRAATHAPGGGRVCAFCTMYMHSEARAATALTRP